MLALVPAVALGWVLARKDFPGKSILNILLFFPMVSPPVATGLILLKLLGRNSIIGQGLATIGIQIPFSVWGAILAAAVVGFPLFVMFIRATFSSLDQNLEYYALSAGHTPWQVFKKIVLPLSYPGIIAGAIVSFTRSLGEFGATVVLAGNIEGETRTISMAIYSLLNSPMRESEANTLLIVSIIISFISLVAFEFFTKRHWKKMEWKQ